MSAYSEDDFEGAEQDRELPIPGKVRFEPQFPWLYEKPSDPFGQERIHYRVCKQIDHEDLERAEEVTRLHVRLTQIERLVDEFLFVIPQRYAKHFRKMLEELHTDQVFCNELPAIFTEKWPGLRLPFMEILSRSDKEG